MKNINYLVVFLFLFIIACSENSSTNKTAPLSVSQENPNYFEYNGKPVILISSTEHYFAMINRKFDLTKWDENYFDRLEKFVAYASERDIIVNYIFFTPFFDDHKWHATPLNPSNNVNAEFEKIQPFDIYTLDKHLGLLDLQKELIKRVTQRLKKYPNVFYEVTFDGGANWTKPDWHRYMVNYLYDNMDEPKQLIAQNAGMVRGPISEVFENASAISYRFTNETMFEHVYGKGVPVFMGEHTFYPGWEPFAPRHAYHTVLWGCGAYTHVDLYKQAR